MRSRPPRTAAATSLVLALALVVTGCTDGGRGEDQVIGDRKETTTSTLGAAEGEAGGGTTTAPPATAAAAPFEGTEDPTAVPSTDPTADRVLLDDLRVGREDAVERVVFEFRGDIGPGYEVRYVDRPVREAGSGDEIRVEGDGLLEIAFSPASTVAFTPDGDFEETYTGPDRVDGTGGTVAEVVRIGDFEARLEWVIGLTERVPYRVLVLDTPLRVVVELAPRP
ncbi:MAG TPA: hypothetical protein VMN58_10225 [Acidimicrobiales bacterium]|nr:hypothetical protein [Acidimicrobiales bacterium]